MGSEGSADAEVSGAVVGSSAGADVSEEGASVAAVPPPQAASKRLAITNMNINTRTVLIISDFSFYLYYIGIITIAF
jgi:hypothetical protein